MTMKTIAVYGSALVQPGEVDYEATLSVGQALAGAGYAVMTGGYSGVMEAASRGAAEAGGHVIGVTCKQIEAVRALPPNRWIKEEIRCDKLDERLHHLVHKADGYIAMPGGVGTLHELVMVWELIRINEINGKPLICFGEFWRNTLSDFAESVYVPAGHADNLHFVATSQEVMAILNNHRET